MHELTQMNRRVHTRQKARISARLLSGRDSIQGTIENVGEGGVFFATEDLEIALEEGAEVTLVFRGRRGRSPIDFEHSGVVLRAERYFDGESVVRAFAVKFHQNLRLDDVDFD
jgi:hypothetical protein